MYSQPHSFCFLECLVAKKNLKNEWGIIIKILNHYIVYVKLIYTVNQLYLNFRKLKIIKNLQDENSPMGL